MGCRRLLMPGPGRVLVGAHHTVESADTVQHSPSASSHPARRPSRIFSHVPSSDQRRCGCRRSSSCRNRGQITPDGPGARPVEDHVDHYPVVVPPRAVNILRRQQKLQPHPLLIGQVVTLQTFLVHTDDLHQRLRQDHGTRPSSTLLGYRRVCMPSTVDDG